MPESERKLSKLIVLPVVAVLVLILLVALIAYFISWPPSSDTNLIGSRANSTLRLVIVVTRHGNRPPLFTYPTYPYMANDTKFWPYGPGQLTTKGRNQLYKLGEKIRSMYNMFVSDKYYPTEFKATSTSTDRTLMSAQALVAGLFPPKGFQVWNDNLLWQPVPVYTTNLDHSEYVGLDVSKKCPRFEKLKAVELQRFSQENEANLSTLHEYVRHFTGMKTFQVHVLWDALVCADGEGLALPTWASTLYPEPLASVVDKMEQGLVAGSVDIVRLIQGQLYQEIVKILEAKAKNSLNPDRKVFLYSAHDLTLRGLRTILGIRSGIVHTGSALVLELHSHPQSTNHFVQVMFIDGRGDTLEPKAIMLPGCGDPCSLDTLMSITQKYYNITDYEQECQTI